MSEKESHERGKIPQGPLTAGNLLTDYVMVLAGPRIFIGREVEGCTALSPAYEAYVKFMVNDRGDFGVMRECVPILGSTAIRRIQIPRDAIVIACSQMTGRERQEWAAAINDAETLIQAIKTAESGIARVDAGGLITLK